MTLAEKQGLEIARRYIYGTAKEREVILSCFSDEEKPIFLRGVGAIHLFDDQGFYNSVRDSLKDRLIKELYA